MTKKMKAQKERLTAFARVYGKNAVDFGGLGSMWLVHILADEKALLKKYKMKPSDCHHVDAWWKHAGNDVSLLQVRTEKAGSQYKPGMYARRRDDHVYLMGVVGKRKRITRHVFYEVAKKFHSMEFWKKAALLPKDHYAKVPGGKNGT